jgi:hypothetical protein
LNDPLYEVIKQLKMSFYFILSTIKTMLNLSRSLL